jgi:CTP synthase (UTP-ammonia lyase)
MTKSIRVGVLGDFNEGFKSHWATNVAIRHSQAELKIEAEIVWIPTPLLLNAKGEGEMERCDGLWASPGSPYASFHGMLRGIEFARTRNWPFVGT